MKLFKIRGGVHPKGRKELASEAPVTPVFIPDFLRVPLQQHIGAPADPIVAKGDLVKKGQLLASGQGMISAPVHAPTSGKVTKIGQYPAPHPSGLPGRTITIKPDGLDEWGEGLEPMDPETAKPADIAARVAECGIVGMGGATFPSSVKLNLGKRYDLHTLVINGAECEPYLTCDDRLMRDFTKEVCDGISIMRKTLEVKRAIIAIEKNKPQALAAMKEAAKEFEGLRVVGVPVQYPMGSEKHLVQTLTGLETPARGLTADIGVVVHNAATAKAVRDAIRLGRPLISRLVTLSGGAMKNPGTYDVLIGTTIEDLLAHAGGTTEEAERMILGGPMMGQPITQMRAPLVKGSNGVLALTAAESKPKTSTACIRCATCVSVCPCGLMPLEMAARIKKEQLDAAVDVGLMDCVACGSCSFACPSSIPLVQYFNYAKGKLTETQRAKHKTEETKRLAEARNVRMERIAKEKKEAMARKKAARAAQKKKEAEAKKAAEASGEASATEPTVEKQVSA
ncbi:MAG: electron transport complex subunit RsxC [Magnetovibrionaceae bacterium]